MAASHLPGVPIFLVGVGPKRVSSGGRQRQSRRPTPPLGGHSQPIRAANHIPRRTRARPHGVNTPPARDAKCFMARCGPTPAIYWAHEAALHNAVCHFTMSPQKQPMSTMGRQPASAGCSVRVRLTSELRQDVSEPSPKVARPMYAVRLTGYHLILTGCDQDRGPEAPGSSGCRRTPSRHSSARA